MSEPIDNPDYWRKRLEAARKGELHHAIFRCPKERWERIEAKHREILARLIAPTDAVLDCGCGWGRLLDLMPANWVGGYLGVDLSPDFIALAKERPTPPNRRFIVGDLRSLSPWFEHNFDWAIIISMRGMVRRNLENAEWDKMETEIGRVAHRLLYMEYDEHDNGSMNNEGYIK